MYRQVTDARKPPSSRPSTLFRQPSRFITVDSVLQYASDVPSMQQRVPTPRPAVARTQSGRPAAPRLAGRAIPPHVPGRTTKVSEKLVLLPEAVQADDEADEEDEDYAEDNDRAPERDDEEARRRTGAVKGKSYAERLPKARRAERLARVTAYCTAQSYRLKAAAAFLRDHHGAQAKLYDDCLYAVFQLPLLQGTDGYRVRSSPASQHSLAAAGRDEVERIEGRDYDEHVFEDRERFDVPADGAKSPQRSGIDGQNDSRPEANGRHDSDRSERSGGGRAAKIPPEALTVAELYIFAYGVAVFWNFSLAQEKDVLADLTFYGSSSTTGAAATSPLSPKSPRARPAPTSPAPLVVAPQSEADFETEEFHFEYAPGAPRPRVYNDMITLRSPDPMVKLAIAHAVAQSTKLSAFEQQAAARMAEATDLPRRLALTGTLGMGRAAVLRLLGALYTSRVDVNLASAVLDTPRFVWDAEPTLHPLYAAAREYLELDPRVKVLDERCRVFLDLAEILSDGVADARGSKLTWIIIALIAVSIVVTCTEVFLRFGMLSSRGGKAVVRARAMPPGAAVEPTSTVIDDGRCVCTCKGPNEAENGTLSPVQRVWKEAGRTQEL